MIAWNQAAAVVLTDCAALPHEDRNILLLIFGRHPDAGADRMQLGFACYVVAAFRADVVRAGADDEIARLVEDLSRTSPLFEALWQENDVVATGDGRKRLDHPVAGPIELEFSSFAVEGRPELSMLVPNPVSPADAERVRSLVIGSA